MLTTLCIVSLDQGKFAPRYDIEPMTSEDAAETVAGTARDLNWHVGRAAVVIWKGHLVRMVARIGGALSHA